MNQELDGIVKIRDAALGDYHFIIASWLQGYFHSQPFFKEMKLHTFCSFYEKVVKALMAKSVMKVACLESDPDVIIGYSVHQSPILHWVFVRPAWRNKKVATALVPKDITTVTHLTVAGTAAKPKHWEFNPFATSD